MARYKDYDYSQGKFIPIHFDRQILPTGWGQIFILKKDDRRRYI